MNYPDEGSTLYSIDPIILKDHYEIDYVHSYAQDSPFFAALAKGKLLGSQCNPCGYTYATPRSHCMQCGSKTDWMELPQQGKIHTFTTCYYGGEAFLKETPFTLILVEFDQVHMHALCGEVRPPTNFPALENLFQMTRLSCYAAAFPCFSSSTTQPYPFSSNLNARLLSPDNTMRPSERT